MAEVRAYEFWLAQRSNAVAASAALRAAGIDFRLIRGSTGSHFSFASPALLAAAIKLVKPLIDPAGESTGWQR